MSKTTKIIIAFVAVAVIAIGAIVLSGDKSDNKNTGVTTNTDNEQTQTPETADTIVYTDSGFSPAELTVAAGSSITIQNNSDEEIEPSSNPHPVHTDNPELNLGDIEPGESKTFTVTTQGSWGYHNHYKKDKGGTIIVD